MSSLYVLNISSHQYRFYFFNKVHISLRSKVGFTTYMSPNEFYTEDYFFYDIIEYCHNGNNIMVLLQDISILSEKEQRGFIHKIQKENKYTYCILVTDFITNISKISGVNYFNTISFKGQWDPYFIDNIEISILSDLYKNIIMGNIQKNL